MNQIALKNVMLLSVHCAMAGITNISKVRVNVNGYKYLTLLSTDDKGETVAENVYFGKESGSELEVDTMPQELGLSEFSVGIATNEKGEERLKLFKVSSDTYASVSNLFG